MHTFSPKRNINFQVMLCGRTNISLAGGSQVYKASAIPPLPKKTMEVRIPDAPATFVIDDNLCCPARLVDPSGYGLCPFRYSQAPRVK